MTAPLFHPPSFSRPPKPAAPPRVPSAQGVFLQEPAGRKCETRGSRRSLHWMDAQRCLRGGDSSSHPERGVAIPPPARQLRGRGGDRSWHTVLARKHSHRPRGHRARCSPRALAGARRTGRVPASSRPAAPAPRLPRPRPRPAPGRACSCGREPRTGHGRTAGRGGRLSAAESTQWPPVAVRALPGCPH
jgi:hypothetical protein